MLDLSVSMSSEWPLGLQQLAGVDLLRVLETHSIAEHINTWLDRGQPRLHQQAKLRLLFWGLLFTYATRAFSTYARTKVQYR